MSPVKFSDVFGNIELSSNVKTTLKNTLVDKVTFNKNTKLMYIYLSSEAILNEDCLNDFSLDISEGFDYVEKADAVSYTHLTPEDLILGNAIIARMQ